MATFTAGKVCRIGTGGTPTYHALKTWSIAIENTVIDSSSFESTADADSNYWRTKLAGLNGATVSYAGFWDTASKPTAATAFRPGMSIALTLTISSGVSFTCTAIIKEAKPGTNVEGASEFSGSAEVSGAVTYA